jgi:peptidoglycan biosynthesis protein MviN/MurJ (putative lipid II flippase)
LVAGFVIAAKLVAAMKEMAIARAFGVSATVDTYLLAFTVATWLPATITAALTAVLVPALVRLASEPASVRQTFVEELMGMTLLAALPLTALTAIGLFSLDRWVSGNSATASTEFVHAATWWFLPLGALTLFAGIASLRVMATGGHTNSLLEGVPALVLLLTVLLCASPLGPVALLTGTTLGAILHVAALKLALTDGQLFGSMRFKVTSPVWKVIALGGVAMAIGQFVNSLATPLDQYFAVRSGEGAVSALGYASRVAALFLGVGATALSRATLPVLSELSPNQLASRLWHLTWRWCIGTLLAGAVVSILVFATAESIIALLFERGAFTERDTTTVASVLRVLAVQFPFFFGGMVLVSYLSVRHAYRDILLAACIAIAVKIIVLFILGADFGALGVATSTVAMYATSFFGLLFLGVRRSRVTQ